MSDGAVGLVLLIVVSLGVSGLIHWRTKVFWLGCLSSTMLSVVIFQLIAFVRLGYVDPFILIAIPVSGLVTLAISVVVGKALQSQRRKNNRTAAEG